MAIIDYLLEDARMNVRRAKLILASCEKSYSDICKLAWKIKECLLIACFGGQSIRIQD